jgi:hypothetical protein
VLRAIGSKYPPPSRSDSLSLTTLNSSGCENQPVDSFANKHLFRVDNRQEEHKEAKTKYDDAINQASAAFGHSAVIRRYE